MGLNTLKRIQICMLLTFVTVLVPVFALAVDVKSAPTEIQCRFVALACKSDNSCDKYKPQRVFLFNGEVDHLVDLYVAGLIKEGVSKKQISRNLEVAFFDVKSKENVLKVPAMKATFVDKKDKLLIDIKKMAEGKRAKGFDLTPSEVNNIAKNADIFACFPVQHSSESKVTSSASGSKHKHGKQTDPSIIYMVQNDKSLLASGLMSVKAKPWQANVNCGSTQAYLSAELPENFHAVMIITPDVDGSIAAGFSKRGGDKPNYLALLNAEGAVLRKQTEFDADLKKSSFKPTPGKQLKLEVIRDHELVRILADGTQILHGDVESDHMLTMKRFFLAGVFTLHDLKIRDLSK